MISLPRLIAIDPGAATGVAVFDGKALSQVFTSTDPHADLQELLETPPFHAVIEDPPALHAHQPATIVNVAQLVAKWAPIVYHVRPTDWKGHPWAALTKHDARRCRDVHQRDAARIGRWLMEMRDHGIPHKIHVTKR